MKSIIAVVVMVCVFGVGAGWTAEPAKGPVEKAVVGAVETAVKGCEKELTTYCKDVTPGEGRGLACLYAYGDKLSAKCEYGLFEASAQLERFTKAVNYAATECKDDLKAYCADIKPGEGRLLQCIDKNAAKVSKRCTDAIKESGLKK